MSRNISPDRERLLAELTDEVRAGQRANDIVDDLMSDLLGINRTDARCVDILEQHGRMSAGQLAEAAGLSTGAVTAVLDRLERAGYAKRLPDPSDRRRVLVEPTPLARQRAWELMGRLGEEGRRLTAPYSDEQLRLFTELSRLSRELQEEHAAWLRERLRERDAKARGHPRRASRTTP